MRVCVQVPQRAARGAPATPPPATMEDWVEEEVVRAAARADAAALSAEVGRAARRGEAWPVLAPLVSKRVRAHSPQRHGHAATRRHARTLVRPLHPPHHTHRTAGGVRRPQACIGAQPRVFGAGPGAAATRATTRRDVEKEVLDADAGGGGARCGAWRGRACGRHTARQRHGRVVMDSTTGACWCGVDVMLREVMVARSG